MKLRSGRTYGASSSGGSLASIGKAVLPYVGAYIASKVRGRFAGSRTATIRGKQGIESTINTTQNDARTRYRYKRQPARRRRRYVRQVRLFDHLMGKKQPLQTMTMQKTQNASAAVDKQISFGVELFTTQVPAPENDLQQLFYDAYAVGTLANIDQKRLLVKSAVLDVQMTNIGTQGCVIDVYRVKLRNVWNATDSLYNIWNTTFGDQTTITAKDSTNPAVTPFQNPSFCKYFKVMDKREILLGAGLTTTFQLRRPGDRWIQGRRVANEPHGLRSLCEGFLFQVRGMPVNNTGIYQLAAVNVAWSYQKTYNYALPVGAETNESIHDI